MWAVAKGLEQSKPLLKRRKRSTKARRDALSKDRVTQSGNYELLRKE